MDKREYYKARRRFQPEIGEIYENEGGGRFECIAIGPDTATMRNEDSDWTCVAHGVGIYPDGRIDWDYSTGGYYASWGGY